MIYVIGNKTFSVAVDSFGAQLNSIKKDGQEKLWQNYDGSWKDHSPMLFPFCGHCAVKLGDKTYPAPAHGFAQNCEFKFISQTETELVLNLSSDAATKKMYPFDFSFTVYYSVKKTTLFIKYVVKNTGDGVTYFGCGGHESFNIDGKLEDYGIEFEKEENLLRFYDGKNGLLLKKSSYYPNVKTLKFKDIPVEKDKTLVFKGIKSGWCRLVKNTGEVIAESHFEGFPNLLFWRPDGAAMICIEPWINLPDKNGETTDFREKEGIYALSAGEERVIERKIVY